MFLGGKEKDQWHEMRRWLADYLLYAGALT